MQGQLINGYELKRLLGQGGMAEVWYAENEIGLVAAVKVLNADLSHNEQIVERFHNEALMMVKLNHPNIRRVYGYGYLGDRHCIIMEYLEGEDLEALIKSGRRFTEEELRRWWNQSVEALNYTHAMGIVHRDIKPSNFFLDQSGDIKLLDFGIAKDTGAVSMTRTGTRMGTLMYMSPEQVRNSKDIDYRTDIYSLALTFVQLFAGKHPCADDTTDEFDIQLSIVTKPVDLSGVPAEWQGFLAPYLEKEPDKRPALRHFEATAPVSASVKPDSISDKTIQSETLPLEGLHSEVVPQSPEPTDQPKSKKKVWPWLISAAVLLTVIVLVFGGKSRDEKAFEACHDIVDYRQYVSQYGLDGKHYAEAKQFITNYVHDSTQKAEKEAKLKELKDVPLFKITENGKTGFIDNQGDVVIPPQFDDGYNFKDELGPVKVGEYWGFINKVGDFVIDPQFESVGNYDYYSNECHVFNGFTEGLTSVKKYGKWGYVDKTGKMVIEPKFDCLYNWTNSNNLTQIKHCFSEGLCLVIIDGKCSYIDNTGNFVIKTQYVEASNFSEGLACVEAQGENGYSGDRGYIDKSGKIVIQLQYDFAGDFSDGLANAGIWNGYGGCTKNVFINKEGKEVIPTRIVDKYFPEPFSEGLAKVYSNQKCGFMDKTGKVVIACQYDGSDKAFSEGLALVHKDGCYRYIDHSGKTVIQLPSGCLGHSFRNGLAVVSYNDHWSYIDKTGKTVYTIIKDKK